MNKRYKVVQDDEGVWGILDTRGGGFALFGLDKFFTIGDVVGIAIRLNAGRTPRETYLWLTYYERRNRA